MAATEEEAAREDEGFDTSERATRAWEELKASAAAGEGAAVVAAAGFVG